MTEITLFRFENKPLEVFVQANGDVVFDASEVCRILELSHVGSALRILDEDEKGVHTKHTLGGEQKTAFITEPGLYKLISRSRKPEAKRFDRWVRHEVLPQIRKAGSYNAAPAMDLNDPAFLRQTLLGYTEKVIALEAEVTILAPKAEGFDRFANSTGRTILREVGKALHIGSKRGIELLREKKWTFRAANGKWHAYSAKVDAGLLDVKYVTYTNSAGEEISTQQVYVTPKGMARLALEMGQN